MFSKQCLRDKTDDSSPCDQLVAQDLKDISIPTNNYSEFGHEIRDDAEGWIMVPGALVVMPGSTLMIERYLEGVGLVLGMLQGMPLGLET